MLQSPKCHKCFIIRAHIHVASLVQFGRSILFVPDTLSEQRLYISLALGSDVFNGLESTSCLFIFCLPTAINQMCLHLGELAHIVTRMSRHVRRRLTAAGCMICWRVMHQNKIYSQFLYRLSKSSGSVVSARSNLTQVLQSVNSDNMDEFVGPGRAAHY